MKPFGFAPLSRTLPYWPADIFGQPEFLDEVGVRDFEVQEADDQLAMTGTLIWVRELSFDLPMIKGFSVALLSGDGFTEVPFEVDVLPDFVLRIPDISVAFRIDANLLRPVKRENQQWVPITNDDGNPKPAELRFTGVGVQVDLAGDLELLMPAGAPVGSLGAVRIGNTGLVLELEGLAPYFSAKQTPPAGAPPGFRGVKIDSLKVYLPDDFNIPGIPDTLIAENLLLGTGGFSGTIGARWTSTFANGAYTGTGGGTLFGFPFGLKTLDVTLKQNIPTSFTIKGEMLLPFFERPIRIGVGIGSTGSFTISLDSGTTNGLYKLTKEGILEMQLDSIGFEVKDGLFVAKLSGQLTPLFGKEKGFDWPSFKVEELSIDSKGHVRLEGGWLPLREQYELDFNGFKVGITRLGFGKTEDGGKWVGFSGTLKLVDGFTAGASVEGLRITWYEDGIRDPKISFNGIGVEFEIPDVLRFKGDVAYRELEVGGESVQRFEGDIKLKLLALKLEIDAKLVVGSARGPQGKYNFFAIYLGAELPTGIPLGSTPLALYGVDGLFALQMAPGKRDDEEWYEDWYKLPEVGVTDLDTKWVNRRGSLAFGGGVTLGTVSDNGFTFACKALLVIVFPGPVMFIEGKANLLKQRTRLDEEPLFRSLAVIDMRQGHVLIGLDAQYKYNSQGRVIDIRAGAEAFFQDPRVWHIYMGERPREKRIRALILKLFEANAYFMIEAKGLATGVWVGYARQWKFGPVRLTLEAWLEANVAVNWDPLHFHGDLWLHGNVEVRVFKFGLGLSVDAIFEADVFDPYHIIAKLEVAVKLPRPLKNKRIEIQLEWKEPPNWPIIPAPLKEVAIEHFKVTTSWPLTLSDAIAPPAGDLSVVPLDCRPHISFQHPVHDDAFVGVNPQPVQPAYERIGDTEKDAGPVKVRYSLKEVGLSKWDTQAQRWQTIAVAGRPPVGGERTLYGSWAAVPQLPSGTGQAPVANVKLWLWSLTPFDYTRHGGSDGDDWFTENFPGYPCVPQDIPDREVCCDFERLDRAAFLKKPWRSPEHPEITLTWQAPEQQRVIVLDPPVDGFTRALCFPAFFSVSPPPPVKSPDAVNPDNPPDRPEPISQNTITINLSAPAKSVRLWVVEGRRDEQVCLDFRDRKPADVALPLVEQGVTFGGAGATSIAPVPTTLGNMFGLNCDVHAATPEDGLTITLPCGASAVELMLSCLLAPPAVEAPAIAVFNTDGEQVAGRSMLNPKQQPEIVRFEGKDLRHIRISPRGGTAFLHKLCFLCPETAPSVIATGFDVEGRPTGNFHNEGNVVEVTGEGLTRVQVTGRVEVCLLKICALFGPEPEEVAHRQEMATHLRQQVVRWQDEGEVLEPFSDYRLTIVTATDAYGSGELSGERHLRQTKHAYFRTGGPPGLTKLSLPSGRDPQDADKFDSGLDDLTRYARQTIPATVPADGKKPMMAKPFYRAYDVGVEFNENYVELMYRMSGRDLGLYLYDSNNLPPRGADGRLLVQSGEWGNAEELTLTEGEKRWLALAESANDCLPVIEESTIARDKKLTSAVAGRVLEPDSVYEARLIPLLLRENFRGYALAATAQGPSGKLGRWEVRDEGNVNTPSNWVVGETAAPVSRYITQTSNIRGGNVDAGDPFKPGTMLLFADDPTLDSGHAEQPARWTDYRLSVYLRAAAEGAIGVVFRYRDGGNYYRLSLDCNGKYRRLVSVADGAHTVLDEDVFAYESQRDYLLTVEAVGETLRVYQDGALIFDVTRADHKTGGVGLYCFDNPAARFSDVRVDDFRQTAQAVYRFQFTTSLFANFVHHLHSYQDETWHVAVAGVAGARDAIARAVKPFTAPGDDEVRAYETLATAVLGQRARQNPREVQVTRVEVDGEPLAFLVQSPEPFDWLRTAMTLSRSGLTLVQPSPPGRVKLADATFGVDGASVDSVDLLLREPLSLSGYRIDSRVVKWPGLPVEGSSGNVPTPSQDPLPVSAWETYHVFDAGGIVPTGTILRIRPDSTMPISGEAVAAVQPDIETDSTRPVLVFAASVEMRIVAPNGQVVHARHFVPSDIYVTQDMSMLRKADGTGFFMAKPNRVLGALPFSPGQYRLKLLYRRDNRGLVPQSPILSEAGNRDPEVALIDIPWQTH